MKLQEFIKKFDYDFPENWEKFDDTGILPSEQYFSHIIQNFADKICEKQREITARQIVKYVQETARYNFDSRIKETEQPKIDEI